MADAMETLKNILGEDAEDKIKTVMGSISQAPGSSGVSAPVSADSLSQIMQLKNIVDSMTTSRDDRARTFCFH